MRGLSRTQRIATWKSRALAGLVGMAALLVTGRDVRASYVGRGLTLPGSTFEISAIFDRNEERIGTCHGGIEILHHTCIAEVVRDRQIKLGIVAVPFEAAQSVADALVEGGVEAILNYAPGHLRVPDAVTLRDIDPVGAMQSMTYYIAREAEAATPTRSSPVASR